MPNNYDQSSTGVNIETSVFYDTGLSQKLWRDNFEKIEEDNYFYIDDGQVSIPDKTITINGDDAEIERAYVYFVNGEDKTLADKKQALLDCIEPSLDNLERENEYLRKQGFDLSFDVPNLLSIVSIGYSQGDYARVWYDPVALEKLWGKFPNQSELKRLFDHLFWDAPIYGNVTINGEDYSYSELMPDEYDYDREEYARIVAEKAGIDKALLLPLLHKDPDCL